MSNILLVDDSALMRNSVAEKLRAAGHVVRDASGIEEASELLHGSAIDVVVLEPNLRRERGMDLVRKIREDRAYKILPVVLYTHSDDPAFLKDARRLKAAKVFHKARSNFEEVRRTIEALARPSADAPNAVTPRASTSASTSAGKRTVRRSRTRSSPKKSP